jgi:hypothetical protein
MSSAASITAEAASAEPRAASEIASTARASSPIHGTLESTPNAGRFSASAATPAFVSASATWSAAAWRSSWLNDRCALLRLSPTTVRERRSRTKEKARSPAKRARTIVRRTTAARRGHRLRLLRGSTGARVEEVTTSSCVGRPGMRPSSSLHNAAVGRLPGSGCETAEPAAVPPSSCLHKEWGELPLEGESRGAPSSSLQMSMSEVLFELAES